MYPRQRPGKIFPKISTLPRQQTEAAHYLDMYKLTVEKKRLQQELQGLEDRQKRIQRRLEEIEGQTAELECGAQQLREADGAPAPAAPTSHVFLPANRAPSSRSTRYSDSRSDDYSAPFLLEY